MFEFIENDIKKYNLDVHGFSINKDNTMVYKKFFHADTRYPVYSATKTITSTAFGIAQDEGKLSADDFLCNYLQRKYIDKLSGVNRQNFEKLTLKRFLTMSVPGFPFRPDGTDWIEFSLMSNKNYGAKAEFSYSNIPAYLVGVALENAVGMPLYEYICQKIFVPLEIYNPPYRKCPSGHFYGATGMEFTLDELSRFGLLYLNKGCFKGNRIVSENWVKNSTKSQIENSDGGYGFFIWVNNDSFIISGKWGQKCIVFPQKNLVITYLSNLPKNSGKLLEIAHKAAELF